MKALRISEDQFECLIEDAIFYEDNSYVSIGGDSTDGFFVGIADSIEKILKNGWSEIYPVMEDKNKEFVVIAGETDWGGTGFVALRVKKTGLFKWIIHLSTMNNPTYVSLEKENVRLTTDLNYPYGLDFVIPIDSPENFRIEKPAANKI